MLFFSLIFLLHRTHAQQLTYMAWFYENELWNTDREPCNDFYDHICPRDLMVEDTYVGVVAIEAMNVLADSLPTDWLTEREAKKTFEKMDEATSGQGYVNRQKFFIQKTLVENIISFIDYFPMVVGWNRYIRDHHFEIELKNKLLRENFIEMRNYTFQSLDKAPWATNATLLKLVKQKITNMGMYEWKFNQKMEKGYVTIRDGFRHCIYRSETGMEGANMSHYCFAKVLAEAGYVYDELTQEDWPKNYDFDYQMHKGNIFVNDLQYYPNVAYYNKSMKIVLTPALLLQNYSGEYKEPFTFMTGVMAYQQALQVYKVLNEELEPSRISKECMPNLVGHLCDKLAAGRYCASDGNALASFNAMRVAMDFYDHWKVIRKGEVVKKRMKERVRRFKDLPKTAQMFYNLITVFCVPAKAGAAGQYTTYLDLNLMLAQIDEFLSTFQCEDSENLVLPDEVQCNNIRDPIPWQF